jgi:lipopolysaccharide heptosyltransferase I
VKILILKPSSLGDVIHALPVLRLLRLEFPEAQIDWWILRGLMPLLEGDPDVRRLIPFDRKDWGKPRHWPSVLRLVRQLRAERYDWILDLQGLARSAVFGRACAGARFVGVRDWRELAPVFHGESVPRPSPQAHAVDWQRALLTHLQVPLRTGWEWIPHRTVAAEQLLRDFPELSRDRWIGFQPGARWDNKRWPVVRFAELVGLLSHSHPGHRIAVFGGAEDRALGQTVAQADPRRCLDLTGRLSLPGMIEALRCVDLLVTNDTGPMHVVAALGKPVIALFGPTDPSRTGPYGQVEFALRAPQSPACAPCLKSVCRHSESLACLNGITPAQVVSAIATRLVRP